MAPNPANRLYFIDAMRAFAILMMLQGHFIYSLLGDAYRDTSNPIYSTWLYGRGMTAPLFFTVSGFIFMYLLTRKSFDRNWENPRVKKGIRRGLQLIAIGYALRLNIIYFFSGKLNSGFWLVDVLQCIGIGLLFLILIYLCSFRGKGIISLLLLLVAGIALFIFQPVYVNWNLSNWPELLANYLTRANGSVFTIIPWIGYTAWGGVIALLFQSLKPSDKVLNWMVPLFFITGMLLVYRSSAWMIWCYQYFDLSLFKSVAYNNFLFIRLGNVLILFSVFIAFRNILKGSVVVEIGQRTLGIYVLHFIVLYGSWFGLGLNKFYYHSLSPEIVIPGAIFFMVFISWSTLLYYRKKPLKKIQTWASNINWSGYLSSSLEKRKGKTA